MLKKPYIVNLLLAFVLIAAGLFSYFSNPQRPPTAFIAPGIGAFFILMTPWMIKENKIVAHVVVLLTLLFGIMLLNMAASAWMAEPSADKSPAELARRRGVFSTMALACVAALVLYVQGFIDKRKAKKQANVQ